MTTLKVGSKGADVKLLQSKLGLMVDGYFGPLTLEGVKAFQKENGLAVDGIVGPLTWRALDFVKSLAPVSGDFPLTGAPTTRRSISEIIVHYSATPEGENFTVEQIRQMHLNNGWADIGYHWWVDLNGEIWKGRTEDASGAHTVGHNLHSIGVCYCGGCPPRSVKNWKDIGKDTRNEAQKAALLKLVGELKRKYPAATVHGHREFASKPCPGFDAKEEYKYV